MQSNQISDPEKSSLSTGSISRRSQKVVPRGSGVCDRTSRTRSSPYARVYSSWVLTTTKGCSAVPWPVAYPDQQDVAPPRQVADLFVGPSERTGYADGVVQQMRGGGSLLEGFPDLGVGFVVLFFRHRLAPGLCGVTAVVRGAWLRPVRNARRASGSGVRRGRNGRRPACPASRRPGPPARRGRGRDVFPQGGPSQRRRCESLRRRSARLLLRRSAGRKACGRP